MEANIQPRYPEGGTILVEHTFFLLGSGNTRMGGGALNPGTPSPTEEGSSFDLG